LQPHFEVSKNCKSSNSKGPSPTGPSTTKESSALANCFEGLSLEEIGEEIFESMPSVKLKASTSSIAKSTTPVAQQCELDMRIDQDLHFAVFCFFEDVHRLHDFISEAWTLYSEGKLDSMAASITTNFAFELVKHEEERIQSLLPSHLKKLHSYE
jgi:hypothetical protein